MDIRFGTSGWRGIISDEFTFENVRLVVRAIAETVIEGGEKDKGILISSDTRFLSDKFVQIAAEIVSAYGIKAYVPDRDTPTPVLSYDVILNKRAGVINFTASHNPPEYNGIKFSPSWGGPALLETTSKIEEKIKELSSIPFDKTINKDLIVTVDVKTEYLKQLEKIIDFDAIKQFKGKVVLDVLYGTVRDYLDLILDKYKVKYKILHNTLDPYFGGKNPTPENDSIDELICEVKKDNDVVLGLATDGDGDRFGIIDSDGTFISPNEVLSCLFYYLLKVKKVKGGIAKSVTTTGMLDSIAKVFDVPVFETPVGFKYLGDTLIKENVVLCGEESGGLSAKGHVPEKDGIFACLLCLEAVVKMNKSMKEILDEVKSEVGEFFSSRIDLHIDAEKKESLMLWAKNDIDEINNKKIVERMFKDGVKLVLDSGAWILLRPSGTEPIIRYYVEAKTKKD